MGHNRKISVVGLGYVGLPVAVAFSKLGKVIGYDVNKARISQLKKGIDHTLEMRTENLTDPNLFFTDKIDDLKEADFYIVTVPTPVTSAHEPDFSSLIRASMMVGKHLKKNDIVVYESTVYPGATEEHCVPVLEKVSNLKAGKDFFVGYSPERINPGDHANSFTEIKKIVSGDTPETLEIIANVYGSVLKKGVHRAPTIKVAEAAKIIENTQRDVNIALMNELAMLFHRMDIDIEQVLDACRTKWNFLPFRPGLVGGHCIGVDPFYLAHIATRVGFSPQMILTSRRINDSMASYTASQIVKQLIRMENPVKGTTITVLGMTFKENVPDIRNTKVVDLICELQDYDVIIQTHDPFANPKETYDEYGLEIVPLEKLTKASCVILAVAHKQFCSEGWPFISNLLSDTGGLVVDLKCVLDQKSKPESVTIWRL